MVDPMLAEGAKHWLVVTDLDGTLLDDSYPILDAANALEEAKRSASSVSLALASSKTLMEMQTLSSHVSTPLFLIFENGAGIAWRADALMRAGQEEVDGYQVVKTCAGYDEIRAVLETMRLRGFPFRGFADMGDLEVAELTGLTVEDAQRSRRRLMSEPVVWLGDRSTLDRFREALSDAGLTLQLGGRFHHVSSGANKATALAYLRGQLRYELGVRPTVLACGDAPNDIELIEKADCALLFPQRTGGYLSVAQPNVVHAPQAGPASWLAGVKQIMGKEAAYA